MKITVGNVAENGEPENVCSRCGEEIDDPYYEHSDVLLCEDCYDRIRELIIEDIENTISEDATRITCDFCGENAEYEFDGHVYCEDCFFDEMHDRAARESEDYFDEYVEDYI